MGTVWGFNMFSKIISRLFASAALVSCVQDASAEASCGRTVFYGDSIAESLFLTANASGWIAVDSASSGAGLVNGTTEQHKNLAGLYLDNIHSGDIVLVSLGTNDLNYFRQSHDSEDAYVEKFRARVQEIQSRGGRPVILGLSSGSYKGFSSAAENYANGEGSDLLISLAQDMGIPYIITAGKDLSRVDGLHYTKSSNKKILSDLTSICPALKM